MVRERERERERPHFPCWFLAKMGCWGLDLMMAEVASEEECLFWVWETRYVRFSLFAQ